jgi:hypothetical protein
VYWRRGFSVIMVGRRPPWRHSSWRSRPPFETRDAKHEPRTLAEQRAAWYAQAAEALGGPDAVRATISKTLNPIPMTSPEWMRSG